MLFRKRSSLAGRVSILIPTMFDSRYTIELCLATIKKYTDYPDYEVIVCDAGVDDETSNYLSGLASKNEIGLIKAIDWQRPKDDLVKAAASDYYILMHDDIQILRRGWLTRRLLLMSKNENNAIVGTVTGNYNNKKRFFPMGLLVKTAVSRELDLRWGKQQDAGFDTGASAYIKFFSQNKYRFVPYNFKRDIRHFAEMTWPKYHTASDYPGLDAKLQEREKKMNTIKEILKNGRY